MSAFPVLTVTQVVSIFSHLMPNEKQNFISTLFKKKKKMFTAEFSPEKNKTRFAREKEKRQFFIFALTQLTLILPMYTFSPQ